MVSEWMIDLRRTEVMLWIYALFITMSFYLYWILVNVVFVCRVLLSPR